MFRILYVSTETIPFGKRDLIELLRSSRSANAARHVTGMLVYCGGEFLQALEGPPSEVFRTFEKIERDPRHGNVVQLERGDSTPLFSQWSMGFSELDGEDFPEFSTLKINKNLKLRGMDALTALDFLRALAASQTDYGS